MSCSWLKSLVVMISDVSLLSIYYYYIFKGLMFAGIQNSQNHHFHNHLPHKCNISKILQMELYFGLTIRRHVPQERIHLER